MSQAEPSSTVLIVDDEALFRSSVADAVQHAFPGFTVLEAADGREALDRLDENAVDVVVTDVSMPVMDGLELMLELRNRAFAGAVIVVTAFGDAMLRSEVALYGGFGYLEKPIELPELIEAVQRAAAGERGAIEGLSLTSFVRLVELERKTGQLRVTCDDQVGDLLYREGVLIDARSGDLSGNDAALDLFSWTQDNVRLELFPNVRSLAADGGTSEQHSAEAEPSGGFPATSTNARPTLEDREHEMGNVNERLQQMMEIDGAIGVALVDHESGMSLGQIGGGDKLNLEVAGAGNTAVVRAKMRVMQDLGLNDAIEDILISLSSQYHLIRPLSSAPNLFIYLALDRKTANLAMARHQLMTAEKGLEI